ncbi:OLC1v1012502C1 [Oldenlandia corymbosa var. corymbosa]|uniref:OLC1v1012502C1 n=1 Tax=Oldenlandia corymbosa var. corymbosa TaxID=529605 RepID=A0AAV1DW53_OLDCO|nr:OLC1v1012502C1 [Oldenlandia corymbosa var. corymbosa]
MGKQSQAVPVRKNSVRAAAAKIQKKAQVAKANKSSRPSKPQLKTAPKLLPKSELGPRFQSRHKGGRGVLPPSTAAMGGALKFSVKAHEDSYFMPLVGIFI